jgi:hypothetical protein
MDLRPTARSLVVCEEVVPDRVNPNRLSLLRVIHSITPAQDSQFPLLQQRMSVFAQVTEGRGNGLMRVEFRFADTDRLVAYTRTRSIAFSGNSPLLVQGIHFQVLNLVIRDPGLYWVQLRYNDDVLIQTPLLVRPVPKT